MARKKVASEPEDNGVTDGGRSHVNGRHVITSHSNARAVQLASFNDTSAAVRRAATISTDFVRGQKTAEPAVASGPMRARNAGIIPSQSFHTHDDIAHVEQERYPPQTPGGSESVGNSFNHHQQKSKAALGLAGLFSRKWKKSSSGSESSNSLSEGTSLEIWDSEDGHRKKTKKKSKTSSLSARAVANTDDRDQFTAPMMLTMASDVKEKDGRRRSLKKLSLVKSRADRDAMSTASDSDNQHHRVLNLADRTKGFRSRTAERTASSKAKDSSAKNGLFEAKAVYRTGSGSILVQAEPGGMGDISRIDKPRAQVVGKYQNLNGHPNAVMTTKTGLTMYPKYKMDSLIKSKLWMNESTMNRSGLSDTEVKTVQLPTVSKIHEVTPTNYVKYHSKYGNAPKAGVGNVHRAASAKTNSNSREEKVSAKRESFVGGHYAPIGKQNFDGILDNDEDKAVHAKISRSRTLGPTSRAVTADVHRSKSPNSKQIDTLDRNRRHRSVSRGAVKRNPTESLALGGHWQPINGVATSPMNDRQSKSADDLSPRVNRRDENRLSGVGERHPNAGHPVDSAAAKDYLKPQQPLMMRTVTIRVTGTKDTDQRDQFDHLREKSKQGKPEQIDSMNNDSHPANNNVIMMMPHQTTENKCDTNTSPESDNVYRPMNGNLPRSDSAESLLRKDQFDFLSERNRNKQLDTIESAYWKGDMIKVQAGSTVDLHQKTALASLANITGSCDMLLSDGGCSESSSTSDQSQLSKFDYRSTIFDRKRWNDEGISSYSNRRRPFLGSTERHRFVRRGSHRISATDELFGRFPACNSDNDKSIVREAPCLSIRSTALTAVQATDPSPKAQLAVQPVVMHDYAEVFSYFTCPDSEHDRMTKPRMSQKIITGTWKWSNRDDSGSEQQFEKIAKSSGSVDVAGKAIFHFRSISKCIDAGSFTTLPIDAFRLVEGSMAPAGTRRRVPKGGTTSSNSLRVSSASGTSSWSNNDDDDDGIIGYRRYLMPGSRWRVSSTSTGCSTSSDKNNRTSDGFWQSIWPFSGYHCQELDQVHHSSTPSTWSRRSWDRQMVSRNESTGFGVLWRLGTGVSICDYFSGMLLGIVVVLFANFLLCNA